ncbi:MAG: CDP-alcohol phosphatidyltransferase family protein [bacterium]|nr:CDP-alcohol phosphatidyltransferase family protein [bacterium]
MTNTPKTRTDFARAKAQSLLNALGMALHQRGIHPDMVTLVGFIGVLIGAIFIANGNFAVAGILLLISLPFDALDGAVARAMKRQGDFGKFWDSTLDRYADGALFGGFAYFFATQDRFEMLIACLLGLIGSFMVSYTRARGEGLGLDVKIGLFSRLERVIMMLIVLFIPTLGGIPILDIGLWILAIGTNITSIQRMAHVYHLLKHAKRED